MPRKSPALTRRAFKYGKGRLFRAGLIPPFDVIADPPDPHLPRDCRQA